MRTGKDITTEIKRLDIGIERLKERLALMQEQLFKDVERREALSWVLGDTKNYEQ